MLLMATAGTASPLDDLTSLDGRVRAEAERTLMATLDVEGLAVLREDLAALREKGPLPTALEQAVERIVHHAYDRQRVLELGDEVREQGGLTPRRAAGPRKLFGFFGVSGRPSRLNDFLPPGPTGASIIEVLPGFVAQQHLQAGDVITAAAQIGRGGGNLGLARTRTYDDLTQALGNMLAQTPLRLFVQRGGRFFIIEVELDVRLGRDDLDDDGIFAQSRAEASSRWEIDFQPLFEDGLVLQLRIVRGRESGVGGGTVGPRLGGGGATPTTPAPARRR
jgi:hypothetical protein